MAIMLIWLAKMAKAVRVRVDSQLEVKDTTIYVGDSWKPEDNFVSATDKTGQDVPFEKSLFQVKLIAKQAFIQSFTVTKEAAK